MKTESIKISKGMLNGYQAQLNDENVKSTCASCGFKLPRYRGLYTKKCPNCGEAFCQDEEDNKAKVGEPYLSTPEFDASLKTNR